MFNNPVNISSVLLADVFNDIRKQNKQLFQNEWNLLINCLSNSSINFDVQHYFDSKDNQGNIPHLYKNIIVLTSEQMVFAITSDIKLYALGQTMHVLDAIRLYLSNNPKLVNVHFQKVETNE